MAKYYYEQLNAMGKHSPCVGEYPSDKRADGKRVKVRCVKKVATEHEHLSLSELKTIYGEENDKNTIN